MKKPKHRCRICNKLYIQVGNHIRFTHNMEPKKYYDKYLAKPNEGICAYKTCKKKTKWGDISTGYTKYCGNSCAGLGERKGRWMIGRTGHPKQIKSAKARRGKSYEEIYGKERAEIEAKKRTDSNRKRWVGKRKADLRPKHNSDYRYFDWRTEVFERDDYTCQHCNTRGGTLHAHHIKPWAKYKRLRYKVTNGLTLCIECHKEEHR